MEEMIITQQVVAQQQQCTYAKKTLNNRDKPAKTLVTLITSCDRLVDYLLDLTMVFINKYLHTSILVIMSHYPTILYGVKCPSMSITLAVFIRLDKSN